jgi:hypothetical protein
MSKPVRSLRGRMEYDPYHLHEGRGAFISYSTRRTPYCIVMLHLFNLPIGAVVLVDTFLELNARRYHTRRAFKVPAWQHSYCETFELETRGRIKIEVHTRRYIHTAEYRIDPARKRPVRGAHSKLEIRVEEDLCETEGQAERYLEKPPAFPPHSLWSGQEN